MSRVWFHAQGREAELRGSERAWLDHIASGPAEAAWDLNGLNVLERCEQIIAMIPEPSVGQYGADYLHAGLREARGRRALGNTGRDGYEAERRLVGSLRTAFAGSGLSLHVAGHALHSSDVRLNTALAAGSDVIALAAKIHGSCEIHGWVDGPDRKWLADLIDDGLHAGIYRQGLWYEATPGGERKWSDQGWGDVTALLRETDDGPVVMSYSITDWFPNHEAAGMESGEFDALSEAERWQRGTQGLRTQEPWLRIGPDTLRAVTFGPAVTVYDLLAPDRDERVRAAVARLEMLYSQDGDGDQS